MHENEKLVFDLCGKTFDTPGRLWSHKLVYHWNKDYSCEKCQKTFLKKITLGDAWKIQIVVRQKVLHDEGFSEFIKAYKQKSSDGTMERIFVSLK